MGKKLLDYLTPSDDGNGSGDPTGALSAGMNVLSDSVSALSHTRTNDMRDTAKGSAIGGGIGAVAGSFLLPGVGTVVGQQLGSMVGKLIGGKSDHRRIMNNYDQQNQQQIQQLDLDTNVNQYGYMEYGGVVGDSPVDPSMQGMPADAQEAQAAQPVTVNIQRGELMVAGNGDILQEFNNPNSYFPHEKTQLREPMGNFVQLPEGAVIIPKKDARSYKEGSPVTRKSILMDIVRQQQLNPDQNDPDMGRAETPQFAAGGQIGDPIGLRKMLPVGPSDEDANSLFNTLNGQPLPAASMVSNPVDAVNKGIVQLDNPDAGAVYTPTGAITDANVAASFNTAPAAGNPTTNPRSIGAIGKRALAFLPSALQAGQALQSDPYLRPVFNHGYDKAKTYVNQLPTDINVNDQIAEADQAMASGLHAISNANTPSARAEASAIVADAARAKGGIRAQAGRLRQQAITTKLSQLAQIEEAQGSDRARAMSGFQNEQRMDAAGRRNILANAASEAYSNFAAIENEDQSVAMLNSISKFVDIDPLAKQKIKEDPQARQYINDYVMNAVQSGMDIQTATQRAYQEAMRNKQVGKTPTTITSQKSRTNGRGVPKETQLSKTVITHG